MISQLLLYLCLDTEALVVVAVENFETVVESDLTAAVVFSVLIL